MNAGIRYEIDDTSQNRPHVRLCNQILNQGVTGEFASVELVTRPGAMPTARVQVDGSWKPFMAFPPPVFAVMVEHFKHMAGVAQDQHADGTILVRTAGRDASVALRVRRDDPGSDALILSF